MGASVARTITGYRVPDRAPLDDALLGAVAQAAGMIVATRNVRHFELPGIACVDPFRAGVSPRRRHSQPCKQLFSSSGEVDQAWLDETAGTLRTWID